MKKLNCEFLLTCDQVILSKDNKISLIGIFDQIFLAQIPGSHPRLSLVGVIDGEPLSEHKLTITFMDPQDKAVYPDQNITLSLGGAGKSNFVAEFVNLPVNFPGIYKFSLYSGKTLLNQTSLTVSQIPQSPSKSKVIN